jgi:hypothetical protein
MTFITDTEVVHAYTLNISTQITNVISFIAAQCSSTEAEV